jgi:hypothetical protein
MGITPRIRPREVPKAHAIRGRRKLFNLTVDGPEKCFENDLLQHGAPATITETFRAGIHGAIELENA